MEIESDSEAEVDAENEAYGTLGSLGGKDDTVETHVETCTDDAHMLHNRFDMTITVPCRSEVRI